MKKEFLLISLLITLSGCDYESNGKPQVLEAIVLAEQKWEYSIDSISIDVSDLGLFYYPLNSFASIEGRNYYFGWNHTTFSLDVIDLDNLSFLKAVSFDSEGPSGIGDVKGLNVVSFDSIFFMSSQKISLMDSSGGVVKSWGINDRNEFEGFDASTQNLTTEESFNIWYDKKEGKLFTRLHFPQYPWCDEKLKYYSEGFIAELDLKTKSFKDLKIGFPEEYESFSYGFRDIPAVSFEEKEYINYTFSISSNIYQYSRKTGETRVIGGTSGFTDNHAEPLPLGDCSNTALGMKHNLLNVKFMHPHYDRYRKLYYRFHWGQISEMNAQGKYNAYNAKPLFITVFDRDFRKISEQEVDRRQGASWCFVNNNGLYVLKPRGKENLLGFNLYKPLIK